LPSRRAATCWSDRAPSGTTTAASIWNTGAIGTAVAFQRYEIAVALAAINFVILRFITPLKGKVT